YGDLLSGYQSIHEQLEEHKRLLKLQEEAIEAEKCAKEAIEAEKRAKEALEAETRAKEEEEAAARNRAAEEENERKNHDIEEESGQTTTVTDEEAAGSKGDQMDMDNADVAGELVGPIPPLPDTRVDNNGASVEQSTSNAQSGDSVTVNEGAIDKVDLSKLDGQDNTSCSMDIDAGNQEEGKNVLPAAATSVDVGNTPVSSDQAVSNEGSDAVQAPVSSDQAVSNEGSDAVHAPVSSDEAASNEESGAVPE
uniref:Uncharacterized protein n=1 Tax=Aegilops tauschii subsp. strangulata TaxID=200361 RepID=A0A453LCJ7_AEGTS